jgi:hypothetical protein
VVFVPLLSLLVAAYAVVPFVRPHIRWVTGAFAIVTPFAALFAKLSGDAFFTRMDENDRISDEFYPRLEEHQDLGTMTLYASIVLAVLTLALVYFVAPRAAAGGAGSSKALSLTLSVLALVAVGVSLYYVFRTGDTGAKAVWEGQ